MADISIYWLVVWNIFIFFHSVGNVIIPFDFHSFQRGRYTTNQRCLPDSTWLIDDIPIGLNHSFSKRENWGPAAIMPSAGCNKSPAATCFFSICHRIGWWDNLQENPIFDGKKPMGFRFRFSQQNQPNEFDPTKIWRKNPEIFSDWPWKISGGYPEKNSCGGGSNSPALRAQEAAAVVVDRLDFLFFDAPMVRKIVRTCKFLGKFDHELTSRANPGNHS